MTRSVAAAVNLPKYQYFEQMAFLHEKSVNKVTETNLSQPSTSPQRFLQKRTNVLHFLVLSATMAANLILQRKVRKTKKDAQIQCNRMHSLNHSKTVMRWLKEVWLTRTTKIIYFVEVSFQCLRSFRKGKKDGPKLR